MVAWLRFAFGKVDIWNFVFITQMAIARTTAPNYILDLIAIMLVLFYVEFQYENKELNL